MKDQQTQFPSMDTRACLPWPWFVQRNNSGTDLCHSCICINNTNLAVEFDQLAQRSYLQIEYCMTHDDSSGNKYINIHIWEWPSALTIKSQLIIKYFELLTNIFHLNDLMCSPLNCKGLLYRDCLDGFVPAIFTTGYACENCTGYRYLGITLYLLLVKQGSSRTEACVTNHWVCSSLNCCAVLSAFV